MSDKWDMFNSAVQRVGDDMDFREVRVFTADSDYNENTGDYEQTYSEHAESPINAELREPNQPSITRDADGAETKVDVRVFVDDDLGIAFEGAEDNPDWPDKIEDTSTGQEYRVYETFNEGNGLIKLYGVKI